MLRPNYDGWHHVYHMSRLNGLTYLQPIVDETGNIQTVDASRWIELWKVASSLVGKVVDGKYVIEITNELRNRVFQLEGDDTSHTLQEIIQNIPARLLKRYIFRVGDEDIVNPSQCVDDLVTKLEKPVVVEEKMAEKTVATPPYDSERTLTDESDVESDRAMDSDEEEKENENRQREELLKDIKRLLSRKKIFEKKPSTTSTSVEDLKQFKIQLEDKINYMEIIRALENSKEQIKTSDTVDSLKTRAENLEKEQRLLTGAIDKLFDLFIDKKPRLSKYSLQGLRDLKKELEAKEAAAKDYEQLFKKKPSYNDENIEGKVEEEKKNKKKEEEDKNDIKTKVRDYLKNFKDEKQPEIDSMDLSELTKLEVEVENKLSDAKLLEELTKEKPYYDDDVKEMVKETLRKKITDLYKLFFKGRVPALSKLDNKELNTLLQDLKQKKEDAKDYFLLFKKKPKLDDEIKTAVSSERDIIVGKIHLLYPDVATDDLSIEDLLALQITSLKKTILTFDPNKQFKDETATKLEKILASEEKKKEVEEKKKTKLREQILKLDPKIEFSDETVEELQTILNVQKSKKKNAAEEKKKKKLQGEISRLDPNRQFKDETVEELEEILKDKKLQMEREEKERKKLLDQVKAFMDVYEEKVDGTMSKEQLEKALGQLKKDEKIPIIKKIRSFPRNTTKKFSKNLVTKEQLNEILNNLEAEKEQKENQKKLKDNKAKMLTREGVLKLPLSENDMKRSFSLDIPTKDNIEIYTVDNKNGIDDLHIKWDKKSVMVKTAGGDLNVISITKEKPNNNIKTNDSKLKWKAWDLPIYRGKKTLELLQVGDYFHVQLVQQYNNTNDIDEKVEVNKDTDSKGYVQYNLRPAQNVTLHATSDDLLISHGPGKGKTFTAILKAEKKRNTFTENKPRILIVVPKASIASQWQNEIIENNFDPRHYIIMTYALFRLTFTTGRYPNWLNLDKESKEMISNKCWVKKNGKWSWKGTGAHVDEYFNKTIDTKRIFQKITGNPNMSRRDLFRKISKKNAEFIQDTFTNKYVPATWLNTKTWLNEDTATEDERRIKDIIKAKPSFYELYQEDIFFHWQEKVKGKEEGFYFFTNCVESKYIIKLQREANQQLQGQEEDDLNVNSLEGYSGYAPFRRLKFKGEEKAEGKVYDPEPFFNYLKKNKRSFNISRSLNYVSKLDPFRDVKHLFMLNSSGSVSDMVIDFFVKPEHGLNLSQHRYQPEKDVIMVLDEAHEPQAITDNIYKVTQKIIFGFAKTAVSTILVTATPMQSENPALQLWNFSKLLKDKPDYDDIKRDFKDVKRTVKKKKLEIVQRMDGLISRSFEMQPSEKRRFIKNIFSNAFLLQKFKEILALHNWNAVNLPLENLSLTETQKKAILRNVAEKMFAVADKVGFSNPFPTKLAMHTINDRGRIRSYMDETRLNVCRYAVDNGETVYFDYRTRSKSRKYTGTTYDQYRDYYGETPIQNFDAEMSEELFKYFEKKFIPLVVKRCKVFPLKAENDEVDGRFMQELQTYAFTQQENPLIYPILADNLEEAKEMVKKHVIRMYKRNSNWVSGGDTEGRRTSGRNRNASRLATIFDFVTDRANEMDDKWKQAKWLTYKRDALNKMPFIPELISSKYRDIVNMMIEADKNHTNGMVFHKNYSVHRRLSETLDAYGSRFLDLDFLLVEQKTNENNEKKEKLTNELLHNAATKIVNKWKKYQNQELFIQKDENHCREAGRVKWDPKYEIDHLKNWGKQIPKYSNGKTYTHRHYTAEKTAETKNLHKLIHELGAKVEEMWKARNHQPDMIEYVLALDTEYKKYVDKVWKLQKPVPISEFGVWNIVDEDGNPGKLYEGRNGPDNRGPSADFTGKIIKPATKLDYQWYVTIRRWEELSKPVNVNKEKNLSVMNLKLIDGLASLLEFTMRVYHEEFKNHDVRYDKQNKILQLLNKTRTFEIQESYTPEDLEKTATMLQTLTQELIQFETEELNGNDPNDVVNEAVFTYIRQKFVVEPTKYKKQHSDRQFSKVILFSYDMENKDEILDEQKFKREKVNQGVVMKIKEMRNKLKWYISPRMMASVEEFASAPPKKSIRTQENRKERYKGIFTYNNIRFMGSNDCEFGTFEGNFTQDMEALNDNPSIEDVDKLINNPYMRTYNTNNKSATWKVKNKIIPEIVYSWYHRPGDVNDKNEFQPNFSFEKKSGGTFTYQKPSFRDEKPNFFAPYLHDGVNDDGLRIETIPSNMNLPVTLQKIRERMIALENKTFLSYMFFNGSDTPSEEERGHVKQCIESGLCDWVLMTEAGITGVDFQSTRRSLMILAQPYRSPGMLDQYVGRLVRTNSHGIIPKLFQRTDFVTFYNSIKRSKTSSKTSSNWQPWRYFTKDEAQGKTEGYSASANAARYDDEQKAVASLDELLEDNMMTHAKSTQRKSTRIANDAAKNEEIEAFWKFIGEETTTERIRAILQYRIRSIYAGEVDELKKLSKKEERLWEKFTKNQDILNLPEFEATEKAFIKYGDNLVREGDHDLSDEDYSDDEATTEGQGTQEESSSTTLRSSKQPEKEEEPKKQRPKGKLHSLVDSQIDNHVLISAVVAVNNHVFSTVQQYTETTFSTVINTTQQTTKDGTGKQKKITVVETLPFGWACHYCHWENDLSNDVCQICGKVRQNRYYKMEREYPLTQPVKERIKLYDDNGQPVRGTDGKIVEKLVNSELAVPQPLIYPETRSDRWINNEGKPASETWTRDENAMWHHRRGYDAKLRERNQMLYMLSMVTVEHKLKQQKRNIQHYTHADGDVFMLRKSATPYALEDRPKSWDELVGLTKNSAIESKISDVIETKEEEFDFESEYSDDD